MVEINFLCAHKKLRAMRLAPVLIREITRRVHLHGIFQAVFTAGMTLPTPVAECQYYHRPLNPKKLIDIGFSHIPKHATLSMTIKLYRLPEVRDRGGRDAAARCPLALTTADRRRRRRAACARWARPMWRPCMGF